MASSFRLLDPVILAGDRPADGLREGQRGTVVEVFDRPHAAYEVEFTDEDGYTVAVITATPQELRLAQSINRS